MRALHSLGYDAQSLDYDERFLDALRELKPDVVFIALHGPGGEDGHVQALLEYLSIPYTGSGLEASALSMDKHLTKKLLGRGGLADAGLGSLRPHRRNAAAACRVRSIFRS